MQEQETPDPGYTRFRIDDRSGDEPTPDDTADISEAPDSKDDSVNALKRRVTVVSMLIFCLVIMVIAAAYIDVRKKFENLTQSSSTEFRILVKNLQERLDATDARYTRLESSLNEILPALSKTTATIKDNLAETKENLQAALDMKADKKSVAASDKRFEELFTEVPGDIQTLKTGYQTLKEDLAQKLAAGQDLDRKLTDIAQTADDLTKQWEESRSETTALLDSKADKKNLQAAVRKVRADVRKELTPLLKRIAVKEKRLSSLEDKVRNLERQMKTDFRGTPANQLPPPASGNISEQAISE